MDAKKPSTRSRTKSSAGPSKAGDAAPARGRAAAPRARAAAPADGAALLADAAAGRFPATLYVEGPDESLKAVFLSEFRRAWAAAVPSAAAARVMRPGEQTVDDVLAAWNGISMFATRELTLVLDVEDFSRSDKRVAALAEGVARPAGESTLVLVESAADNARKTLEPLRAACAVRWSADRLAPRELLAWGKRRMESAGIACEAGALEALLEVCEAETTAFFNELGKLEAWCAAAGRATKADVEALSRPVVGADLPEYLLAVASGQPGLAAQRLGRLVAAGESEGGVLWALGNLVSGALGGWTRWRDLAAALARRRPARELARALDAVYRAEAAWKGGRVDALTALEVATRDVAG